MLTTKKVHIIQLIYRYIYIYIYFFFFLLGKPEVKSRLRFFRSKLKITLKFIKRMREVNQSAHVAWLCNG